MLLLLLLTVTMTSLTHGLDSFFLFFLLPPAGDFGFEQVDPLEESLHECHRHGRDGGVGRRGRGRGGG